MAAADRRSPRGVAFLGSMYGSPLISRPIPESVSQIRSRLSPWSLAAASGIALSLGFPTSPGNLLAGLHHGSWTWVGLVPLLVALRRPVTLAVAFRLGWVTGTVFATSTLYWVAWTRGGGLAVVGATGLLAVYLGLFPGLFAGALRGLLRRWGDWGMIAAPVLWVAQEYLVSLGQLGFPWLLLANSQAATPRLVQYVCWTGAYGVSAWVVLLNALVVLMVEPGRTRIRRLALGAALTLVGAFPLVYAHSSMSASPDGRPSIRVGVIQPDPTRAERWGPGGMMNTLLRLEEMSRRCAADDSDIPGRPGVAANRSPSPPGECGAVQRAGLRSDPGSLERKPLGQLQSH